MLKKKIMERIDKSDSVDNETAMERCIYYGKGFCYGYIQCLFNEDKIDIGEAIELQIYVDKLQEEENQKGGG